MDQKTLQRQVFEYLDANLEKSIKAQLNGMQIKELVRCFADWAYTERVRCSFEVANNVAQAIQGKREEVVITDSEFLKDLEKL